MLAMLKMPNVLSKTGEFWVCFCFLFKCFPGSSKQRVSITEYYRNRVTMLWPKKFISGALGFPLPLERMFMTNSWLLLQGHERECLHQHASLQARTGPHVNEWTA